MPSEDTVRAIQYRSIRRHVRSGDLVAFEGKTLAGRLIRTWTGSRYAHVGIAMWLVAKGAPPRLFVLESRTRKGVSMRLLSNAGDCWYLPTGIAWNADVNRFVWPLLGTAEYDWASIFRLLSFRRAKRDRSYYCSEFAGEVLQRGGFPIEEVNFSDPGELVQSVLRNGPGQIFWISNHRASTSQRQSETRETQPNNLSIKPHSD
jgi:hypothetical protein